MLNIQGFEDVTSNPITDLADLEDEVVTSIMRGLQGSIEEADICKMLDKIIDNLVD